LDALIVVEVVTIITKYAASWCDSLAVGVFGRCWGTGTVEEHVSWVTRGAHTCLHLV
jgi:hypothetical protein